MFCLASEAFAEGEWEHSKGFLCEMFKRTPGWKLNDKWVTEDGEFMVRERRCVGVCQDGLLTVTARLREPDIVMATTSHKSHTIHCLHHSGKQSFKHLKSFWLVDRCIKWTTTGRLEKSLVGADLFITMFATIMWELWHKICVTVFRRSVSWKMCLWSLGNWRYGRFPPEEQKWALARSPLKILCVVKHWTTRYVLLFDTGQWLYTDLHCFTPSQS